MTPFDKCPPIDAEGLRATPTNDLTHGWARSVAGGNFPLQTSVSLGKVFAGVTCGCREIVVDGWASLDSFVLGILLSCTGDWRTGGIERKTSLMLIGEACENI